MPALASQSKHRHAATNIVSAPHTQLRAAGSPPQAPQPYQTPPHPPPRSSPLRRARSRAAARLRRPHAETLEPALHPPRRPTRSLVAPPPPSPTAVRAGRCRLTPAAGPSHPPGSTCSGSQGRIAEVVQLQACIDTLMRPARGDVSQLSCVLQEEMSHSTKIGTNPRRFRRAGSVNSAHCWKQLICGTGTVALELQGLTRSCTRGGGRPARRPAAPAARWPQTPQNPPRAALHARRPRHARLPCCQPGRPPDIPEACIQGAQRCRASGTSNSSVNQVCHAAHHSFQEELKGLCLVGRRHTCAAVRRHRQGRPRHRH